ncbi:MAG: serine hydrolase domain-containing protein [Nannocystaceae bacterium]
MHRGLLALGMLALACGDGPATPQPVARGPGETPATATPRPWSCLQQAEALPLGDRTVAKALCAELRVLDVPGGVVAVAEQGRVTVRFAAGVRCAGDAAPVTPQTAFRLGSISKSMTAALAYALAERGVVDLDAPLQPARLAALGVDPTLSRASLRQLLDHRAGLPDVIPDAELAALPPTQRFAALVGHPFAAPDVTWATATAATCSRARGSRPQRAPRGTAGHRDRGVAPLGMTGARAAAATTTSPAATCPAPTGRSRSTWSPTSSASPSGCRRPRPRAP